jgi:putative oxidoreductase
MNPIARWHSTVEDGCARHGGIGLSILRLVTGGHLMAMTQDNVFSWTGMLEFRHSFAHRGFAWPLACAVSVAGQFFGGLALVPGLFTRFAGLVVAFSFVVAIVEVDSKQPYPAAFAPFALVAAGLCVMLTGAGRYTLDHVWRRRA